MQFLGLDAQGLGQFGNAGDLLTQQFALFTQLAAGHVIGNESPIAVPPLREHAEDIPLLVEIFLRHFTAKHKRRRQQLSAEAMQLCQRFAWPGNVRQLRNIIERLVLTCHHAVIEVGELPDFLLAHDRTAPSFAIRPGMTLAEVEKLLIRQTLVKMTANRAEAAKLLGISRRALQYKLKRYGLLDGPDAPRPD